MEPKNEGRVIELRRHSFSSPGGTRETSHAGSPVTLKNNCITERRFLYEKPQLVVVPRAPVEFVVLRHLLTHPGDSTTEMARHTHISPSSASLALARLRAAQPAVSGWNRPWLWQRLLAIRRRPTWRTFRFQVPNPDNWLTAMRNRRVPFWFSGEVAAAREGIAVVPNILHAYVEEEALAAALSAAKESFAKVASANANLVVRVADPWLAFDGDDVEAGQRLLDYQESRNIQLAKVIAELA